MSENRKKVKFTPHEHLEHWIKKTSYTQRLAWLEEVNEFVSRLKRKKSYPNLSHKFILIFLMLIANHAYAAVQKEPVQSGLELQPDQRESITIETGQEVEIGWEVVQEKRCETTCVRATNKTDENEYYIGSDLGASMKYQPVDGKVAIEFENTVDHPVTVNVHKIIRTCDAEACALIGNEDEPGRWLVFKVDEFRSIETSADGSYSVISGVTTAGKEFTVKAVWWTEDKSFVFGCAKFIKDYLDNGTPKEEYSPYILSGNAIGESEIVLKSVDTCTPKAPNFGVPQENVY